MYGITEELLAHDIIINSETEDRPLYTYYSTVNHIFKAILLSVLFLAYLHTSVESS